MNDLSRSAIHELVDRLPNTQLPLAASILKNLLDPLTLALASAPADDEPLTDSDRAAIGEAEAWLSTNQPIPLEKVLSELGFTQSQWLELVASSQSDT